VVWEVVTVDVWNGGKRHALAVGSNGCSREMRGQKSSRGYELLMRIEANESRKILVVSAEAVTYPRTHTRAVAQTLSGDHLTEGLSMIPCVGMHSVEYAQFISMSGYLGIEFRDPESTFTMLAELEG
jgi:hypothetical protein